MDISEIKKGDKLIYSHDYGFQIVEINKVLKTKIKCTNKMEFNTFECKDLTIYNYENLEKAEISFKQEYKKNQLYAIKRMIGNSKLKLQALKELLEEIEKGEC